MRNVSTGRFAECRSLPLHTQLRFWCTASRLRMATSDPPGHPALVAKAIGLAVELKDIPDASTIFARNIRSLWWSSGCQNDLDAAATAFSNGGVWIAGWLSFRAALRFEGKGMPHDIREQLECIIDRLKPVDLVDRARSLTLDLSMSYTISWTARKMGPAPVISTVPIAELQATVEIGKAVAASPSDLDILLREISSTRQAPRACEFGRGLAQGALHLEEMWSALKVAYAAAAPESCNPFMMGGFLTEAHVRDPDFAAPALDAVIDEPGLASVLPSFRRALRSTPPELLAYEWLSRRLPYPARTFGGSSMVPSNAPHHRI